MTTADNMGGGTPRQALADLLARHTVDDAGCLRWTGPTVNGKHPRLQGGRKTLLIRRAVWVDAHGRIPPGKVLRCTCETPLCVEVSHLRLMTYREIARTCGLMSGDARSARIAAAKRAGPQAKLTDAQVQEIRASVEPGKVLADRFGVTGSLISRIRRGECRREYGLRDRWAGMVAQVINVTGAAEA